MDVVCRIGALDLSNRLSTFSVAVEPQIEIISTLSNKDHVFVKGEKNILSVSFWPLTEEEEQELYNALSSYVPEVSYTHPHKGDVSEPMRLISPLDASFALRSVDGQRRYKGSVIQLRSIN